MTLYRGAVGCGIMGCLGSSPFSFIRVIRSPLPFVVKVIRVVGVRLGLDWDSRPGCILSLCLYIFLFFIFYLDSFIFLFFSFSDMQLFTFLIARCV